MNRTALIDADILLFECSAVAEIKDEDGEVDIKDFDFVKKVFDAKVELICEETGSDEYFLYITGVNNFRLEIAKQKEYKGNRKAEKPYHYQNLKTYIRSMPECVEIDGMEADDAMSIEQTRCLVNNPDSEYQCVTVICTRDKDLRMVPGLHYGWEMGNQPRFNLQEVDEFGTLEKYGKQNNKVRGTGLMFFYAQLIMGDATDNIPGIRNKGPVAAYDSLHNCQTEEDLFDVVSSLYHDTYGDDWAEFMIEQGQLLWMVRELDANGDPVMWEFPAYA